MALEPDHRALDSSPRDMGSRRGVRAREAMGRRASWRSIGFFKRPEAATANSERNAIFDFNRGVTLAAVGDTDGAVDAYRRAIRSAPDHLAARAAFNIAVLRTPDLLPAAAAYRVAIDSGDEHVAPRAAFNLGLLLEQHGDLAGAERAFEQACGFGQDDISENAAVRLLQLGAAAQPAGAGSAPRGLRLRRHPARRRRGYQTRWLATPIRSSRIRRARGHAG